jgi:hypothetical protein
LIRRRFRAKSQPHLWFAVDLEHFPEGTRRPVRRLLEEPSDDHVVVPSRERYLGGHYFTPSGDATRIPALDGIIKLFHVSMDVWLGRHGSIGR